MPYWSSFNARSNLPHVYLVLNFWKWVLWSGRIHHQPLIRNSRYNSTHTFQQFPFVSWGLGGFGNWNHWERQRCRSLMDYLKVLKTDAYFFNGKFWFGEVGRLVIGCCIAGVFFLWFFLFWLVELPILEYCIIQICSVSFFFCQGCTWA